MKCVSNWSNTLNIIQNIDDTIVAKAMYGQFGKKTILIEMKIKDSRDNNPVINSENDDWVLVDVVSLLSLSSTSCSISFIYLLHSLNFLSIIA